MPWQSSYYTSIGEKKVDAYYVYIRRNQTKGYYVILDKKTKLEQTSTMKLERERGSVSKQKQKKNNFLKEEK